MKFSHSIAGVCLLALLSSQNMFADYRPKVGETHADFTLPDIATGKPVSLSDYRGKKVILIQFASW